MKKKDFSESFIKLCSLSNVEMIMWLSSVALYTSGKKNVYNFVDGFEVGSYMHTIKSLVDDLSEKINKSSADDEIIADNTLEYKVAKALYSTETKFPEMFQFMWTAFETMKKHMSEVKNQMFNSTQFYN
jgi:hypothetical protein